MLPLSSRAITWLESFGHSIRCGIWWSQLKGRLLAMLRWEVPVLQRPQQGLGGTVMLGRDHELHLQGTTEGANPQGWFLQLLGWLFSLSELMALGFH